MFTPQGQMIVNTTHTKIMDVIYVVVIQQQVKVLVQVVVVHLKNTKVVDGNVKHMIVVQEQPHQYKALVKVIH